MYDMYPEAAPFWGPAKHDPEHPLHRDAEPAFAFAGTALRDADGDRPDDN